jgi:hypothetical protein
MTRVRPRQRPRVSMVWWLQRGVHTRSHPELGRENPQRRWYCVLRRGRVGRCQTFQTRGSTQDRIKHLAMTEVDGAATAALRFLRSSE